MIDLDSLIAAPTTQPGAVLLAGNGAITGIGLSLLPARPAAPAGPVAAAGNSSASPAILAAKGFQAALAKVQLPPPDNAAKSTTLVKNEAATVVPAGVAPSETTEGALPLVAPAQLTRTIVPAEPTTIGAIAPALPDMPLPAIARAEKPSPAIAQLDAKPPAPAIAVKYRAKTAPISQPVIARATDGNLPKPGKLLPVSARPVEQGADAVPVVASTHHDPADAPDETPPATGTADPIAQPVLGASSNMALALPASPPPAAVSPTRATKTTAAITTTTAIATPAPVDDLAQPAATASATFSKQLPALPIIAATLAPTVATADATPAKPALGSTVIADTFAPAPSADRSPASPAVTFALLPLAATPQAAIGAAIPVTPAQSAPDPSITMVQPIRIVALAAPILAGPTLAILPASLSTASRLARQSGTPHDVGADAAATTGSAPPASAPLSVIPDRVATTASATAPAAAPPQDFATLVDRLLDARASAQGAHMPQQISTTVTHGDFGKVSLTFEQGSAGLSVSMTSADPGFAPAAQSAIGSVGHSDVGRAAIVDRLSVAPSDAAAVVAGQGPGGSNQGFGQPNTSSQGNPGTAGQGNGFANAGGGSSQSQAQPQAQQRPGFIAAASRTLAAAGSNTATNQDIFA